MNKAFINTNVLLYLLSQDNHKANRTELILQTGCMVSIQVLNEIANVARRKLLLSWKETNELLELIQSLCLVQPLTIETHQQGMLIAESYQLSIYDSMIVSAAILGGCDTLYSEDMHDGLIIEKQLRICNPF